MDFGDDPTPELIQVVVPAIFEHGAPGLRSGGTDLRRESILPLNDESVLSNQRSLIGNRLPSRIVPLKWLCNLFVKKNN
jgi:hypothetical protein